MKKYLINRLMFLVVLSILAVGCASTDSAKKIKAFSDATVLTTQNTINAFDVVERKYYDSQVAKITANYDTDGFNPNSIERFLEPPQIEARIQVLNGLQKYSEKLSVIMGNEQLDEFDEETRKLGESLTKVNNSFAKNNILSAAPFDSNQIQIFTTAVNALGRWFIEHKREEGVKKSVGEMQGNVGIICELFAKDIGTVGQTGLREQLWRSYSDIMKAQDAFILQNKDTLDPIAKRDEIKYLASLVIDQKKADETLKSVQKALEQLKETHSKLNEAFSDNTIEIDNLIKQLKDEGRRIKKFYESLEK
ncbi:MAG: hypothetical protein D8M57_16060 [Candidatus Scalindua sp. AMX11]|nr:MAG: hypothetical protein DWQ00_03535 [Candidatus Scalindua sp.]NOG82789.1 hypothetical protein [Planctomycetota bacterium]RZV69017.1 MAG: hypothetical protein EX341_16225 [Candidatus Scalindua sp. SCAELEC01]TDE63848.1 MAG: hypothetical protein D8M57_16060 [Candidatus Scalindua sp. AMX11]GJQ60441.1 MAG: hypothetical protein SCALA701_32420 [Candidatus Scalindua sp.]